MNTTRWLGFVLFAFFLLALAIFVYDVGGMAAVAREAVLLIFSLLLFSLGLHWVINKLLHLFFGSIFFESFQMLIFSISTILAYILSLKLLDQGLSFGGFLLMALLLVAYYFAQQQSDNFLGEFWEFLAALFVGNGIGLKNSHHPNRMAPSNASDEAKRSSVLYTPSVSVPDPQHEPIPQYSYLAQYEEIVTGPQPADISEDAARLKRSEEVTIPPQGGEERSDEDFLNGIELETNEYYRELLTLVRQDVEVAHRLILFEKKEFPSASVVECIERAISRLERDRG